jgi:hypothetical protein
MAAHRLSAAGPPRTGWAPPVARLRAATLGLRITAVAFIILVAADWAHRSTTPNHVLSLTGAGARSPSGGASLCRDDCGKAQTILTGIASGAHHGRVLRNAGHAFRAMADSAAPAAVCELLARAMPAAHMKAGSRHVDARVWMAEILASGGMTSSEDRSQRAELGDGGHTVDLAVLGILRVRHMGRARSGWTDEDLAEKIGQPVGGIIIIVRLSRSRAIVAIAHRASAKVPWVTIARPVLDGSSDAQINDVLHVEAGRHSRSRRPWYPTPAGGTRSDASRGPRRARRGRHRAAAPPRLPSARARPSRPRRAAGLRARRSSLARRHQQGSSSNPRPSWCSCSSTPGRADDLGRHGGRTDLQPKPATPPTPLLPA